MKWKVCEVVELDVVIVERVDDTPIKEEQEIEFYSLDGESIFDPDIKEFLGKMGNIKGTGRIILVTEKHFIVKVDKEIGGKLKLGDFAKIAHNREIFNWDELIKGINEEFKVDIAQLKNQLKNRSVKVATCGCLEKSGKGLQPILLNSKKLKCGMGAKFNHINNIFNHKDIYLEHNYCPQCGKQYIDLRDTSK